MGAFYAYKVSYLKCIFWKLKCLFFFAQVDIDSWCFPVHQRHIIFVICLANTFYARSQKVFIMFNFNGLTSSQTYPFKLHVLLNSADIIMNFTIRSIRNDLWHNSVMLARRHTSTHKYKRLTLVIILPACGKWRKVLHHPAAARCCCCWKIFGSKHKFAIKPYNVHVLKNVGHRLQF